VYLTTKVLHIKYVDEPDLHALTTIVLSKVLCSWRSDMKGVEGHRLTMEEWDHINNNQMDEWTAEELQMEIEEPSKEDLFRKVNMLI